MLFLTTWCQRLGSIALRRGPELTASRQTTQTVLHLLLHSSTRAISQGKRTKNRCASPEKLHVPECSSEPRKVRVLGRVQGEVKKSTCPDQLAEQRVSCCAHVDPHRSSTGSRHRALAMHVTGTLGETSSTTEAVLPLGTAQSHPPTTPRRGVQQGSLAARAEAKLPRGGYRRGARESRTRPSVGLSAHAGSSLRQDGIIVGVHRRPARSPRVVSCSTKYAWTRGGWGGTWIGNRWVPKPVLNDLRPSSWLEVGQAPSSGSTGESRQKEDAENDRSLARGPECCPSRASGGVIMHKQPQP